jgi:collagen type III alpha
VVFDLWGQRGWAGQEVVGESNYLDQIKRVVGKSHHPDGAEHLHPALLVPEPDNPHDRNAVAVKIGGQTVGYLPREDAAEYSRVLQRLDAQGFVAQVQARIWASDFNDYEVDKRGNYMQSTRFGAGVRVDLGEPHLLVPGNSPPRGTYELLPVGGAIQVTGEEAHTDILAAYCGAVGEQWAFATLHEMTQQLARSTRTVVEVRLDDQRIGQLTPKMSGDLLAAIRHINELGSTTSCRALVKGNRAAAQVTLYVKRSHELEDAWFDDVRRRHGASPA